MEKSALKEHLAQLVGRRRSGEIDDAGYAALYFLCWQIAMHGRRCAARKYKRDPRPDAFAWWNELQKLGGEDVQEHLVYYLLHYGFLGVASSVPATLCAWLRGRWPLRLYNRIPDAEEVLNIQACGMRPVTILSEYPRMLGPVLNKSNAYAFMEHDLQHAYKYYHDPELYAGQKSFFVAIARLIRQGILDNYRRDPLFAEKFNYLISDMNTHVMHSLQFLRAILVEHYLRRERKPRGGILSADGRREIQTVMDALNALRHSDSERPAWHQSSLTGA